MPNDKVAGLPEHLAPLLQPTPSGVAKLIAAWDGLDTESQILILTALDKDRLPAYLNEKIRIKALGSANAYVRYLGARGLYFSRDDGEEKKVVRQRIEEDPDPLVRYSILESRWGLLDRDPKHADAFFALPHEARLARVRSLEGNGEAVANLIAHAVDHQLMEGKLSEMDLFEILSDYVNRDEFRAWYDPNTLSRFDGGHEYNRGRDVEALWRLVLKLPEGVSYVLIERLPYEVGLNTGIPEEVIAGMTDAQLAALLYRKDIGLKNLRRQLFFNSDEKRIRARDAAICYNFNLDHSEFHQILTKPAKEKTEILGDLSFAHHLSLCIYEAIGDVLMSEEGMYDSSIAESVNDHFKEKLGSLKAPNSGHSGWYDSELESLKLYRLAKTAVPWKKEEKGYAPSEDLEFLSKGVVEGDTWSTFMAFSKIWAEQRWRTKTLKKHLPRIAGGDEGETEGMQTALEISLGEFSMAVTRVQSNLDRQKLFLYVVISLLVWLLIKLF